MFTIEQYNVLTAAIGTGALEVQYSDKKVKYRDLEDMLKTKALMEQQLGIGAFAPNKQGQRRYGDFNSGKY